MPLLRAAAVVLAAIVMAIEPAARAPAAAGPTAGSSTRVGPLVTVESNTTTAGDDASIVTDWNRMLIQIVETPGRQPLNVHPTRSFAILQAAIYDAVVSIRRDARPYLFGVPAPRGASSAAAVAQAGYTVLAALYPGWAVSLDGLLATELSFVPDGPAKVQGEDVGAAVASLMLALRTADGSASAVVALAPGTVPGAYRPTPPNFPAPAFTGWASVTPFVIASASQFRPAPPPSLTSAAYGQAVAEVERLGQDTSAARTPDQTEIGTFWAPPIWNTWNAVADREASVHHAGVERTAALLAALDLSFADATIAFYDAKYHYLEWRPVTAIRLAGTDGNAATVANPEWLPLANTAADPSYPGAHSTIAAAGAAVLASFFGDRDAISVESPALPGVTRTFTSYSSAALEAGLSRIYAGQHFRFDHDAGAALGRSVASYVLAHTSIAAADGHDGDGDRD